jgi:hypothetical protein
MGADPEIPGRTRGKSKKFREVVRFTVISQALPDENRPNPEYSGDVGDSTRMGPSDLVGGSLSSGTRQHARIGKFRLSAIPRTQKWVCLPRGTDPPPQLRHRPPRCSEPLPGAGTPIFGCRGGLGRLDFGGGIPVSNTIVGSRRGIPTSMVRATGSKDPPFWSRRVDKALWWRWGQRRARL